MSKALPLDESVLKIVARGRPELALSYPRTYVVRAVNPTTHRLDLDPPPDAPDLQPIDAVEQWSLGGAFASPRAGSLVLVVFRDALETRPVVVAFAPMTTASPPYSVEVDASGFGCSATLAAAGTGAHVIVDASGTNSAVALGASADAVALGAARGPVVCYGDKVTVGVAAGFIVFVAGAAPFDVVSKVKA